MSAGPSTGRTGGGTPTGGRGETVGVPPGGAPEPARNGGAATGSSPEATEEPSRGEPEDGSEPSRGRPLRIGSGVVAIGLVLIAVAAVLPWWYESESATQVATFPFLASSSTTSATYEFFPGPWYQVTCAGSSSQGFVSSSECPTGTTTYTYASGPVHVGAVYAGAIAGVVAADLLLVASLVLGRSAHRRGAAGPRARRFPRALLVISVALAFLTPAAVALVSPAAVATDSPTPTHPATSTPSNSFWGSYENTSQVSPTVSQTSDSTWGAGSGWYICLAGAACVALGSLLGNRPPPRRPASRGYGD